MRAPRNAAILSFLVFITALAGCLGGDEGPDVDSNDNEDVDYGAVDGTVRNAADLEAVGNIRVQLIQDGDVKYQTNTTDDGTYLILRVAPGTYRIHLFSVWTEPVIEQIVVHPGDRLMKDFLVDPLAIPVDENPFVEGPYPFRGYWSCAVTHLNEDQHVSPCHNWDSNHAWTTYSLVRPGLRTITAELHWTPTPTGAQEFRFRVVNMVGGDYAYVDVTQESPIRVQIQVEDLHDGPEERQFEFYDDPDVPLSIKYEVRPTSPSVVYAQDFTVYWAFHHWENADSSYSPSPD